MEKARILVAEDEGIVALDVRGRLEDAGYAVCAVVASGEDAVEGGDELQEVVEMALGRSRAKGSRIAGGG